MLQESINLGKKISHRVNTTYPHLSTSKFVPMYEHMVLKRRSNKGLDIDVFVNLDKVKKGFTTMQKYIDAIFIKTYKVREKYNSKLNFINLIETNNIIKQLKKSRLGNCHEKAHIAQKLLAIKGYKPSIANIIKNGCDLGHVVCVFNHDGTEFDNEIINNKTIILDPWLDVVDLANNYFKNHEGVLNSYLNSSDLFESGKGKFELINFQKNNNSKFYNFIFSKIYPKLTKNL